MYSNVSDDTTNLDVCGFLKNTKNLNILREKDFSSCKKIIQYKLRNTIWEKNNILMVVTFREASKSYFMKKICGTSSNHTALQKSFYFSVKKEGI